MNKAWQLKMKRWCFDAEMGFFDVWDPEYEANLDFYVRQHGFTRDELAERPDEDVITKQLVEAQDRQYAYIDDFDISDFQGREWEDVA